MISPIIANEIRSIWARITIKTESTELAADEPRMMENMVKKIRSGIRTIEDGISMIKSGLNKTEAHEIYGKSPTANKTRELTK